MNPKLNKSRSNCRAMGMVISRDGNMTYNSAVHHRRSIRLQEYDYAQAGAYFVTICTHNHQPIFGKIELDSIGQSASAQNGRGQPVGAGLAPALCYQPPCPYSFSMIPQGSPLCWQMTALQAYNKPAMFSSFHFFTFSLFCTMLPQSAFPSLQKGGVPEGRGGC